MKTPVFLMVRLGVGISMLGHGLVRLPKLDSFSEWMTAAFQQSLLPALLAKPFSYALPIFEFGVGLLLLLGCFMRQTLTVGALVVVLLIFGTCMIENWEAIPSQLLHLAFFALLRQYPEANSYSIDQLLLKKGKDGK